jgi:hypothetical protein
MRLKQHRAPSMSHSAVLGCRYDHAAAAAAAAGVEQSV